MTNNSAYMRVSVDIYRVIRNVFHKYREPTTLCKASLQTQLIKRFEGGPNFQVCSLKKNSLYYGAPHRLLQLFQNFNFHFWSVVLLK